MATALPIWSGVRAVYWDGLENRWGLIALRGFESHLLRKNFKKKRWFKGKKCSNIFTIWNDRNLSYRNKNTIKEKYPSEAVVAISTLFFKKILDKNGKFVYNSLNGCFLFMKSKLWWEVLQEYSPLKAKWIHNLVMGRSNRDVSPLILY